MPFPAAKPIAAEAPSPLGAVETTPLADVPAALLIHRGDAVLAANRRLLDLTGYTSLASLQAAGLDRLFRALPPDPRGIGAILDGPHLIATARGGSRPVTVEGGATTWHDEPAVCLILRPVAETDPIREQDAERLAEAYRDGHAAEARGTLDALDDGIVTLDPAARVVAMNRAAAELFACDPREVVGTGFEALFDPTQRDTVRASVAGLGTETQVAARSGRPLALRVSSRNGVRVAVMRMVVEDRARPRPGFDRPAYLGHLDRAIRTPVTGIVGLADRMLAEPHEPIDERDRATLREIRASADQVRGLVSDLIDLAIIKSGGLTLALRPLRLNDLVSGCVELLQSEAVRGRIVLQEQLLAGPGALGGGRVPRFARPR